MICGRLTTIYGDGSASRDNEWKYTPTASANVTIVDTCFCAGYFGERGLKSAVAQVNISFPCIRASSRGPQCRLPGGEAKLVRCNRDAIDVAIGIRTMSQIYRRRDSARSLWSGAKL